VARRVQPLPSAADPLSYGPSRKPYETPMSTENHPKLELLEAPGKLPELKRAFNQTNDALSAVRVEGAEYARNALEEARRRIAEEVQQRYRAKEDQLQAELEAIEQALEDEKDALARAGIASAPQFANSPTALPVGTIMIEDEEAISRLKRSPRRAVVEIVNRDTFNTSTNKLRAGLGDFALRILKNDGTPTEEYAPMDRYRWLVDNNQQ
jgi:hypothetical protein